jgi:hypothetical protein
VATASDLLAATERHLLGGTREQRNKLAADVTVDATSWTFTFDLAGIKAGSRLSVGTETIYVWEVSDANKTATVERGFDGSAAAAHASGALVTVNPRFTRAEILSAVNDDLADLSSPNNGLFRVRSVDVTYNPAKAGYDLPTVGLIDVIEVRWKQAGSSAYWPTIRRGSYQVSRNMDTAEFPSGTALFLTTMASPGLPLRVRYKSTFGTLSALADDVETATGLPATAHDLPPIGAALRLMAGREVKRNFTEAQGDTRRAEEVPPGAVDGSSRGLERLRRTRIADEASRLAAQYPTVL